MSVIARESLVSAASNLTTATDDVKLGYLWRVCLIAAMGGLLFGYDWVVIGGAKPFYEPFYGISASPFLQGLAMSTALIGCLVGAVASGAVSDRHGRQRPLIASAILFTVSAIGTALAPDFVTFNIARLIGGIGIGLASSLSPMYIAEVSPAAMRGRFVSINQLTVVLGILLAQVINWLIAEATPAGATPQELVESWNGQFGWRWMFGAETPLALAFLLLLFTAPESPRWLLKAKRREEARLVLARVGGDGYANNAVVEIESSLSDAHETAAGFAETFDASTRPIMLLGIGLVVLQQWCGINVIFNYAQEVFAAAGYDISGIMQTIVLTGVVNLLFTLIAIATVDRLGRRKLMLWGSGGLALLYALLGWTYYREITGAPVVVLVIAAVACYAMTLAPVTWVVIAEIFPNHIRGAAMAVAVFSLWLACTVLTFTFPYLNWSLGAHGTFWLYSAICMSGLVFIQRRLPETNGKSLEQIEAEMAASRQ
ncbi:MAG: sugar porter family MFS transporter [Pirellulales bacterium]|nr:sugar porter family MFS transporter [Pirellulales bacterium]